jgi:AcrR family transcriptional regulator
VSVAGGQSRREIEQRKRRSRPGHGPKRGRSRALAGRRGEILDAALEVFGKSGYHRATIEEIRLVSGASVGSIYHRFGGKEQLAAALYLEGLADYQRGFLRTIRNAGETRETVEALVRHHLRWVAQNPEIAAFLMSTRGTEVRIATDSSLESMNRRVIDVTRAWLEDQELRPMPARLFYAIVIGPAQEFARLWIPGRDPAAMAEAERHLPEAAWRAVR